MPAVHVRETGGPFNSNLNILNVLNYPGAIVVGKLVRNINVQCVPWESRPRTV